MKKKQVQWKSFNINMPDELKPIYDFLQNELNFILSNDETRAVLDNIDLSKLRGDIWRDLRDNLKYSNGMPMTSEDFLRTISKWKNSKSFYEDKYLIIKVVNDKISEKMKKTMKKLMLLNLKIREKILTMNLLK